MNAHSDPISPQKRRAAVIFICITIVIDVLGFGIIIPVLPKLVQQLMGGDAAKGATMFGVFGTVWALMRVLPGAPFYIAAILLVLALLVAVWAARPDEGAVGAAI